MKTTIAFTIGFFLAIGAIAQTKKIVFVCEHGAAKSIIAATYFNKLAKENNLPWEAVARGTNPDSVVSPNAKKLLESDQVFDKRLVPQKISQKDIDEAQQVVLFWPLPGTIQNKTTTRDWVKVQAVNNDYQKLKNDIVSQITPLIDSLKRNKVKN